MTFSIPTLMPEDIECRVQQVKETQSGVGATVLLYKNARVDMRIRDDVFGPMNWQREHARDNANCIISVWDGEKNQWIRKEDTGTESNAEAEKGLASDSFKRAGFNWGIGRELYTAPFIFVKSGDCKVESKRSGSGYTCNDRFYVSDIGYDDNRVINRLQIRHQKSNIVVFGLGKKESEETEEPSPIDELKEKCESHNIDLNEWAKQWGKNKNVNNLTDSEIDSMLVWIRDNFGDE